MQRRYIVAKPMASNQVHPLAENGAGIPAAAGASAQVSHPLPMRFCSFFTAEPTVAHPNIPGSAFRLLPPDRAAAARGAQEALRGVICRHSRYQFLMNFRLHGSRFATAASIAFHIVCIIILILTMVILYHDVTGNNNVSNGASEFCSTKCQNSGVCSTFQPLSSSSTSTSSQPPDRCYCLPGFYGDSCESDLRSSAVKKTGYSFSTLIFKNVYEQALVYMIFITTCLCLLLLSLMRAIASAVLDAAAIKRVQPVFGSIRFHSFGNAAATADS